jgi:hypothetical protein
MPAQANLGETLEQLVHRYGPVQGDNAKTDRLVIRIEKAKN